VSSSNLLPLATANILGSHLDNQSERSLEEHENEPNFFETMVYWQHEKKRNKTTRNLK
jgi:hypothetical protein